MIAILNLEQGNAELIISIHCNQITQINSMLLNTSQIKQFNGKTGTLSSNTLESHETISGILW